MSSQRPEIRVYIEGAAALRPGFSALFRGFPKEWGIGANLHPVLCGDYGETLKLFLHAVQTRPESQCLVLVDADETVDVEKVSPIEHLKRAKSWEPRGKAISDLQVHLMVVEMESWFLADRKTLTGFYGKDFIEKRLPPLERLEQVPKTDLQRALKDATRPTSKGEYHKVAHGTALLERIDAALLHKHAPSFRRLVDCVKKYGVRTA